MAISNLIYQPHPCSSLVGIDKSTQIVGTVCYRHINPVRVVSYIEDVFLAYMLLN